MARYEVVIEETGNGYAAGLPDLPGCVATGDTVEETTELIVEAVKLHVEVLAEEGVSIPEPSSPELWEKEYGMPIPESVVPELFIEISVVQNVPVAIGGNLDATYYIRGG